MRRIEMPMRYTHRGRDYWLRPSQLDALLDEAIRRFEESERRKARELSECRHCRRALRVAPGSVGMCAGCVRLPGHDAESRLLRALFNEPEPCERCARPFAPVPMVRRQVRAPKGARA